MIWLFDEIPLMLSFIGIQGLLSYYLSFYDYLFFHFCLLFWGLLQERPKIFLLLITKDFFNPLGSFQLLMRTQ